ncbi:unnamed protein product [Sphacelaria rigidula]
MVNVMHKKCGYEGCSTHPSYGVAGSKRAEFCSKHARAEMVNVVQQKCGYEGCSTRPSYGVAGSNRAEFCFKHARTAMVNVVTRRYSYGGCCTHPSYGIAGSKRAEFCSKHARAEMVNVENKKCGYEGCFTRPSYGVAGSTRAEFCSKHTRAGMVNVVSGKGGEEEWFELTVNERHIIDEAMVCRQHDAASNTAQAPDTARLHSGEGTLVRNPTKDDGGSVADVRGTKRKRAGFPSSVANDGVSACRSAFAGPRQVVRTTPPASRAGEFFSEASAVDWMKVELAVRSATHRGDRDREGHEQAVRSSGWTNEGRRSSDIGSGGVSSGRLCGSPDMARERLGTSCVDVEQAQENSNVKLELGVTGPSPRVYDIS